MLAKVKGKEIVLEAQGSEEETFLWKLASSLPKERIVVSSALYPMVGGINDKCGGDVIYCTPRVERLKISLADSFIPRVGRKCEKYGNVFPSRGESICESCRKKEAIIKQGGFEL